MKKHCSDRISKLETDKKHLGDVKSEDKKRELVDLVEHKYQQMKQEDESCTHFTLNHVKAYLQLVQLI